VNGWDVDTVRGDSVGGAHMLTRHLIELGHRRIALLTGPANTSTSQERLAGYEAALKCAGIELVRDLVCFGEFRQSSGQDMAHAVLNLLPPPTAIFGANNAIALGALAAVGDRGGRVPQDVALVCFDDVSASSQLFPFLTVAEQPAYQMGLEAAELLFTRLNTGKADPPQQIVLPTRLIVRLSCGSSPNDAMLSLPLPQVPAAAA
jgi:LacI family transcriptional regulator